MLKDQMGVFDFPPVYSEWGCEGGQQTGLTSSTVPVAGGKVDGQKYIRSSHLWH